MTYSTTEKTVFGCRNPKIVISSNNINNYLICIADMYKIQRLRKQERSCFETAD